MPVPYCEPLETKIRCNGQISHDCTRFGTGNINQLVLRLEPYVKQLQKTNGLIGEFVNPKYTDASRTAFKSATRLECMMQVHATSTTC